MPERLAPQRRSIRPRADDTLETVAAREFPDAPLADTVEKLKAWNPHLGFGRRAYQYLLVSDLVYVEPPPDLG